jgi:hypothetical protein
MKIITAFIQLFGLNKANSPLAENVEGLENRLLGKNVELAIFVAAAVFLLFVFGLVYLACAVWSVIIIIIARAVRKVWELKLFCEV